jgi:hypothetical protein
VKPDDCMWTLIDNKMVGTWGHPEMEGNGSPTR